jgi:hypothetical protein
MHDCMNAWMHERSAERRFKESVAQKPPFSEVLEL